MGSMSDVKTQDDDDVASYILGVQWLCSRYHIADKGATIYESWRLRLAISCTSLAWKAKTLATTLVVICPSMPQQVGTVGTAITKGAKVVGEATSMAVVVVAMGTLITMRLCLWKLLSRRWQWSLYSGRWQWCGYRQGGNN
jgi:hypothetical protein